MHLTQFDHDAISCMMLKEAVLVVVTLFKHNHNSPVGDAIEFLFFFCSDSLS